MLLAQAIGRQLSKGVRLTGKVEVGIGQPVRETPLTAPSPWPPHDGEGEPA